MLRNTHGLAKHVDEGYDQGPETDAAKGVGHGSAECASGCTAGHTAWFAGTEEPRAIYARDDAVDGVLDPFRDPVGGKGHKHDEADDFGGRASSAATGRASRVGAAAAGLVFDVDGYQCNGEPCAECYRHNAPDCAYEKDMAEAFGDVHGLLEHHDAEWYPWYPTDEADDAEDAEKSKDHGGRVIVAVEIVDACADAEGDVQDSGDPDELLGKGSGGGEVGP